MLIVKLQGRLGKMSTLSQCLSTNGMLERHISGLRLLIRKGTIIFRVGLGQWELLGQWEALV
jgi:hypothetical protein